jgi:hypothetical protein
MTPTRTLALLLVLATFAAPASGAPAKRATRAPAHRTSARGTVAHPAPPKSSAGAPETGAGRTLNDIHIEGEIATPQVLFITARDQRRIVDLQHRRYLETSREVGERTILPSRIGPVVKPPDAGKETQR